jgi:hypothetical protein
MGPTGGNMRVRLMAISILALVSVLVYFVSPAIRSRAVRAVFCLFPPDGLELPAGQGISIPCHPQLASSATIELLVDGVPAGARQADPGDDAAWGWIPGRPGTHTLAIVVRRGSREVSRASCRVLVVPAGSPVRVAGE